MTVAELIAYLEKVEDKTMPVLVTSPVTDVAGEICDWENVEADTVGQAIGPGPQYYGIVIKEF